MGVHASANAAVHRAMRQKSLKVPWREIARACQELIEWCSFALWTRAIIDAEKTLPGWLRQSIDQRCPGFLEGRRRPLDHESIWVDLSGWVDECFFETARQDGWLDALHYYAGRDPRSEQVWRQYARAETAWRGSRPAAYPSFEEWHDQALRIQAPVGEGEAMFSASDEFAAQVNDYVEREAFAFWIRDVVEAIGDVPPRLQSILSQRCPGFESRIPAKRGRRTAFSALLWRELLDWIEEDTLKTTKRSGSVDVSAIRAVARMHLRSERIAAFWSERSSRWKESRTEPYPDFEVWLQEADDFVIQ